MKRHPRPTTRAAFTLVELLVAMALIIVIMTILSAAFSVSLDTFSQLKAIGDMQEQLRSTSTILRRDLSAHHCQDEADNHVRLSNMPTTAAWDGSKKGFFYIRQDSALTSLPPSPTYEGMDADGIPSWRATDQEFGMTIKLSAKTQSETFGGAASVPVLTNINGSNLVDFAFGTQYVSQWAEVYYFLRPTSVRTSEANGGTFPLYTLYRRQRVLSPTTMPLPIAPQPNPVSIGDLTSSLSFAQVVQGPPPPQPRFMAVGPEAVNAFVPPTPPTPGVYIPANRLGGWHDPLRTGYVLTPAGPGTPPGTAPATFDWRPYPISGATDPTNYGSDVVLNNVVSFRIQILNAATGQFENLTPPAPGQPAIYDTARPVARPAVRAIRIQLRVYNAKSSLTRQVSIIQDL